jgi:methylmalonyl-CoA mutase C-terminal domain/subunit
VLGGIIPEQDRKPLREMGIAAVFGPGTSTQEIVEFIQTEKGVAAKAHP